MNNSSNEKNDHYIVKESIKHQLVTIFGFSVLVIVVTVYSKLWILLLLLCIGPINLYLSQRFKSYVEFNKIGIHIANWNGIKSSLPDIKQIEHINWHTIESIEIVKGYRNNLEMIIKFFSREKEAKKLLLPYGTEVSVFNKHGIIKNKVKLYSGRDIVSYRKNHIFRN